VCARPKPETLTLTLNPSPIIFSLASGMQIPQKVNRVQRKGAGMAQRSVRMD